MKGTRVDPTSFKAPYIPRETIWAKADAFRKKYWASGVVPVNISAIVEFELELEIFAKYSIKETADVDALLLGDLKTIVVDRDIYMKDRWQNRLRFSFAHEVGHLVLHADVFSGIRHSSIEDWIRFMQLIPMDQYSWIEQHAYEFAGRLLVPRELLIEDLKRAIMRAEERGFAKWDSSGDAALGYVAKGIAPKFAVSDQVIE